MKSPFTPSLSDLSLSCLSIVLYKRNWSKIRSLLYVFSLHLQTLHLVSLVSLITKTKRIGERSAIVTLDKYMKNNSSSIEKITLRKTSVHHQKKPNFFILRLFSVNFHARDWHATQTIDISQRKALFYCGNNVSEMETCSLIHVPTLRCNVPAFYVWFEWWQLCEYKQDNTSSYCHCSTQLSCLC
jgi:hypothetical protein